MFGNKFTHVLYEVVRSGVGGLGYMDVDEEERRFGLLMKSNGLSVVGITECGRERYFLGYSFGQDE